MPEKRKIAFYSILSSGHLNVCISIGKILLDKHPNFEVWFIVDKEWHQKLSKTEPRFKFGVFDYEDPGFQLRIKNIVESLEATLTMNSIDKLALTWKMFMQDETLEEVDRKSEEKIREIQPDFLLCDQGCHLPAMINSEIPYAFVCSANPLMFSIEGFPTLGSECRVDDEVGIQKFVDDFEPHRQNMVNHLLSFLDKRGAKYDHEKMRIDRAIGNHFSVYAFPNEIDYFSDEIKEKYNLWQMDTSLFEARIPKPFELPEEFAKLPGKIVYLSLGSLFSLYVHLIQRLVDMLNDIPDLKFIVSKGMNGDKLKFPSNRFIGENYVNQLAVLQVADAYLAHGGNNSLGEAFYFGVPCAILPVLGDQPNNGVRLEETGFGFNLNVVNCSQKELEYTLDRLLNDEPLRLKWKNASSRIQKEKRIEKIVDNIAGYVDKLKSKSNN